MIIAIYVFFLFSNIEQETKNIHDAQKECVIKEINKIKSNQLNINLIDFINKIEVNKISFEYTPLYFDINYTYNLIGYNNIKLYPLGINTQKSKNGFDLLIKNNCLNECNDSLTNEDLNICSDFCEKIYLNIKKC